MKTVNITDTGKTDPATPLSIFHVMQVELVFSDGKTKPITAELVGGNLRGKTELAEFNASLFDLKHYADFFGAVIDLPLTSSERVLRIISQ